MYSLPGTILSCSKYLASVVAWHYAGFSGGYMGVQSSTSAFLQELPIR